LPAAQLLALGHFHDQQLAAELVPLHDLDALPGESRLAERAAGEVAGDEKVLHPLAPQLLKEGAGELQPVEVERADAPVALQQRYVPPGVQPRQPRVVPARERLPAHHAEIVGVHEELQVQLELMALQRAVEIAQQLPALLAGAAELRAAKALPRPVPG